MFCNFCGAPNPDASAFCNKCGKAIAATAAAAPVQAQPIAHQLETAPLAVPTVAPPIAPATPLRQEVVPSIAISTGGALTPTARAEFTSELTAELGRQVEDKCYPATIAAWLGTLIIVWGMTITWLGAQAGIVVALIAAFAVAGMVFKFVKAYLEDKYVHPVGGFSDEMLVTRYNEAKADRRAARTRTSIGWAVFAIVGVLLVIAWLAARHQ